MKNVIRRLCFFSFLPLGLATIISGCANSNDCDIFGSFHGVITDCLTDQPLEHATILLSPGGITKGSDASGYYRFENLEVGQYTITVQKQGYQANRKTVTTISGEDLQVDIQLTPIPQ